MSSAAQPAGFGWLSILRLGLVQSALGAVVVLATSTMNRVMVVEFALPATLPGALVALHYAVQMARPKVGHRADIGGRLSNWILAGMAVLALGGLGAALAVATMATHPAAGIALAVVAYAIIGLGVGAAGTSLLALMALEVAPTRRGGAATIVWIMMIAGFAVTSGVAGHFLDPFSPRRLVAVTAAAVALAFAVASLALLGLERRGTTVAAAPPAPDAPRRSFRQALAEVWDEPAARRFTIFVFVSMLAYSAEELLLEPFAGRVFALTPGRSTQLSGLLHGGAVLGMLLVAIGSGRSRARAGSLRGWTVAGCLASGVALAALALAGGLAAPALLTPVVFALGLSNGVFAVAAIGSMMELAGAGRSGSTGVRMGLWGAAQAVAFALGGLSGTIGVDLVRAAVGSSVAAYGAVFVLEAALFAGAAQLALRLERGAARGRDAPRTATRVAADPLRP